MRESTDMKRKGGILFGKRGPAEVSWCFINPPTCEAL